MAGLLITPGFLWPHDLGLTLGKTLNSSNSVTSYEVSTTSTEFHASKRQYLGLGRSSVGRVLVYHAQDPGFDPGTMETGCNHTLL